MNREQLSEKLAHCIRCGFCLESCPTFKISGEEIHSPRGRLYLMRGVLEAELMPEVTKESLDACLGCRACETACPSGVEYGVILEEVRAELERRQPSKAKRLLLNQLTAPAKASRMIRASGLLPGRKPPSFLAGALGLPPQVARIPKPQPNPQFAEIDPARLPEVRGEVALVLGCVMRVLYPGVHQALRRLLRRVGYRARDVQSPCCGSMKAHAGYPEEANQQLTEMLAEIPPGMPIILDSAGCGSHMKAHGVPCVFDATEFLLDQGLESVLQASPGLPIKATYHDACHLAHGQRVTQPPRQLLKAIPGIQFVEMTESDTCCGSGGIYNALQPERAKVLLDRKVANLPDVDVVAMGNPGCQAWIAQGVTDQHLNIEVLHTLELLERALS